MPTFFALTRLLRWAMKYTSGCMKKYDDAQVEQDRDAEEEREAAHRADRRARRAPPAPMSDTRSAARMVWNDFSNARSTDERTVRPVRTSSFNFSK